ncbi:uncharacterized protein TrAFT101_009139 [Trichoderma asperellum]|uniref:uncharacterized protein n=1 Tax=Trichoderma asperellum TaxID=101201 RepID=UPI00332A60DD|nr:hypothetical protein TrAFT101_009139 [Trichoderma asperellum]
MGKRARTLHVATIRSKRENLFLRPVLHRRVYSIGEAKTPRAISEQASPAHPVTLARLVSVEDFGDGRLHCRHTPRSPEGSDACIFPLAASAAEVLQALHRITGD